MKGEWHPYCSNSWSHELGSKICSNLLPNSTLDDVQTFDVSRYPYETVMLMVTDVNNEAEQRLINIRTDDFEGEERLGDVPSCELGHVVCVQAD